MVPVPRPVPIEILDLLWCQAETPGPIFMDFYSDQCYLWLAAGASGHLYRQHGSKQPIAALALVLPLCGPGLSRLRDLMLPSIAALVLPTPPLLHLQAEQHGDSNFLLG